jgi:hypothetical protein
LPELHHSASWAAHYRSYSTVRADALIWNIEGANLDMRRQTWRNSNFLMQLMHLWHKAEKLAG